MKDVLYYLNLLFLAYFVFLNGFYLCLIVISAHTVRRYARVSAMTSASVRCCEKCLSMPSRW